MMVKTEANHDPLCPDRTQFPALEAEHGPDKLFDNGGRNIRVRVVGWIQAGPDIARSHGNKAMGTRAPSRPRVLQVTTP